jgi:hypothetical protein
MAQKAMICLFVLACPAVKGIMIIAFGWGQKAKRAWLLSPVFNMGNRFKENLGGEQR